MIKRRELSHPQGISHTQEGFAIVLTLLVISLALFLVTYIAMRGMNFGPYAQLVSSREQAKELVLSGIDIATAQLVARPQPSEKKQQPQESEQSGKQQTDEQFLLQTLLPGLNRWNVFNLKEGEEGIDAVLEVSITSEEGKINLNEIYDFDKHDFIASSKTGANWTTIMQEVLQRVEKHAGAKDLFKSLSAFLKKQPHKLNDITQLLTIPEFSVFKTSLFYEPPTAEEKQKKRPLYLTDIFTTNSSSSTIQPWLLSDSLAAILELPRAQAGDKKARLEKVQAWIKEFKPTAAWKDDWNKLLKPVYQKELQSLLKGIESMLSPSFEPIFFSVLCQARVGRVTQRMCVILERIRTTENNEVVYTTAVRKLYWL